MWTDRLRFNQGDKRPVYTEIDSGGSATLEVLPESEYALMDADGAEVVAGTPGFGSAASTVRAWVWVDTEGLDVGTYTLLMTLRVQGENEDDERRYVRRFEIVVS